jgi:small-conductance mechanosensitive channel
MQPINYLAGIAADASFSNTQDYGLRMQIIAQAGAAILVLLAATTISIYKPWGKIQLSLITSNKNIPIHSKATSKKSWNFYLLIGCIILTVIFMIIHVLGGGMGHH